MSYFGGVKKIGGEWTANQKSHCRDVWQKAEQKAIKRMKADGFDISEIVVPLPWQNNLKKYQRDRALKKQLEPYQTINPLGLKKHIVEQLFF